MDMVGRGTADVATTINLNIAVVETDLDGWVSDTRVLEEERFEVSRVKEVWVLGELRTAFVAEHYTAEEAVAFTLMQAAPRRYANRVGNVVGTHKDVNLISYPLGLRVGPQPVYSWEN